MNFRSLLYTRLAPRFSPIIAQLATRSRAPPPHTLRTAPAP